MSWAYGVKRSDWFCKCWVSFGWQHSGWEWLIIWSQSGRFGQDFHVCLIKLLRHIVLGIFVYISQSLFPVYSVNTGVHSWGIKPPECEFKNLPPFGTSLDVQWNHISTLPIRLHTVNWAKRTFTFHCVPIYMHLYLQPVYDRNVPRTVQRIAFLITLPTITWVFITFLGLYMS